MLNIEFLLKIYLYNLQKVIMNIKKTLGEKVKRLRKKRGITQEQLAEMINIAPKNLSKIEVGSCFVTAETLDKIIVALDTTTEELFANNHIKDKEELLKDIYSSVESVKNEQHKLEMIYKMLNVILEE